MIAQRYYLRQFHIPHKQNLSNHLRQLPLDSTTTLRFSTRYLYIWRFRKIAFRSNNLCIFYIYCDTSYYISIMFYRTVRFIYIDTTFPYTYSWFGMNICMSLMTITNSIIAYFLASLLARTYSIYINYRHLINQLSIERSNRQMWRSVYEYK